jgi:hypothetical protein
MATDRPGLPVETVRQFATDASAAADVSFGTARQLLDGSSARAAALELGSAVKSAATMYEEALAKRAELERDNVTRPELKLERWREYAAEWEDRANQLNKQLSTENAEKIERTLQSEALPVSGDPSAALLAARRSSWRSSLPPRTTRARHW